VAQLTEALGIERFAAMGWSSGGPYAAGCAARMKERVTNVALLSSAVPLDIYGTMRGLSSDDRILLFLVRRVPRLASALMRVTIADASDALLLRELRRSFPAVDRAVLTERGSPTDALVILREAMRQGTRGCLQDYRIFGDPWGFSLGEISAPVHIWEGTEDRTGPPEYRVFLKREIPHASVTVVPGEGHLSLLPHHAPAILSELVSQETVE
jgi:pimeloyl-ACP methyl ester carboxylesterase